MRFLTMIALAMAMMAATPAAAEDTLWGALAFGDNHGQPLAHMAFGYNSKGDASTQARVECEKSAAGSHCKVVATWEGDEACRYVSTGETRAHKPGWGMADTPEAALAACNSKGLLNCTAEKFGGCNSDFYD